MRPYQSGRLALAGAAATGAGQHLRAADQGGRIDAEGPSEQGERDDRADAEAAGASADIPAAATVPATLSDKTQII